MASHSALIVALVILCGITQQGDALKCYSCASDPNCNDEFDSGAEGVNEIDSDDCQYCTKYKSISESAGTHRVSRGCYDKGDSDTVDNTGCITCTSKDDGDSCKSTSITCYCDEDNCNHGNRILISWISLLLAVVSKMVFF